MLQTKMLADNPKKEVGCIVIKHFKGLPIQLLIHDVETVGESKRYLVSVNNQDTGKAWISAD